MRGTGISRFGSGVGLAVLVLLLASLVAVGCGAGAEDTTTTTTTTPSPGEQSTTTASNLPTGPSETTPAPVEAVTTTTTELTTTTTELTTTTTGVQVTHESGESPCYIKKIYSYGGKNYIVVDYIRIEGYENDSGEDATRVINTNPRLRTFEIPKNAWIGFHELAVTLGMAETDVPSETGVRGTLAALKRGFRLTNWWWDIKVSDGKVVSIVETWSGP